MVAEETLDDPVDGAVAPEIERSSPHHEIVTVTAPEGIHRIGLVLPGPPAAAVHRARRAPRPARRPGRPQPAARRRPRLHRARLPARHARARRHPAGRLRAGAVAARSTRLGGVGRDRRPRRALRARRRGRALHPPRRRPAEGPLLHARDARRPPARVPAPDRAARRCCPSGRYGHWKSRDVYNHQTRGRGRLRRLPRARPPARRDRARLAVGDAIQHVGVQPAPVPGRRGHDRRAAGGRRADRGVGRAVGEPRLRDGQYPPDAESARLHRAARAQLRAASTSCATPTASRWSPSGGWAPARRSTSPAPAAEAWWREQAKRVLELGVEGIKADDGEGWYIPDDARFADGTHRRRSRPGATG